MSGDSFMSFSWALVLIVHLSQPSGGPGELMKKLERSSCSHEIGPAYVCYYSFDNLVALAGRDIRRLLSVINRTIDQDLLFTMLLSKVMDDMMRLYKMKREHQTHAHCKLPNVRAFPGSRCHHCFSQKDEQFSE